MNSQRIYLDHAATTPLRAEAAHAMHAARDADFNPSSLHAEGRRARALLEHARERAASVLQSAPNEITFTSGGTEANNLALFGVLRSRPRGAHVVTTTVEHHAVLDAVAALRDEGYPVTVLSVGPDGRLAPENFAAALRPETALASVMYANNETGSIQPIAELARIARARGVLFHTDAVQAPCWLSLDVEALGVDLLTLSAHKFYGPKGSGLLYARRGVPMVPLFRGGGQEFGRRPGTQNVAGAAGLAAALELAAAERAGCSLRVGALRDHLERGIRSRIGEILVNGQAAPRLPGHLNVSLAGAESAALLIRLDLAGVAVSAGSACTSGSLEPSHVLAAIGVPHRFRSGTVRFSLGAQTSLAEVEYVVEELPQIVDELRRPAGLRQGDG